MANCLIYIVKHIIRIPFSTLYKSKLIMLCIYPLPFLRISISCICIFACKWTFILYLLNFDILFDIIIISNEKGKQGKVDNFVTFTVVTIQNYSRPSLKNIYYEPHSLPFPSFLLNINNNLMGIEIALFVGKLYY